MNIITTIINLYREHEEPDFCVFHSLAYIASCLIWWSHFHISDVFRCVQMCSDVFRCVPQTCLYSVLPDDDYIFIFQMCSDIFRCVQMRSDVFRCVPQPCLYSVLPDMMITFSSIPYAVTGRQYPQSGIVYNRLKFRVRKLNIGFVVFLKHCQ